MATRNLGSSVLGTPLLNESVKFNTSSTRSNRSSHTLWGNVFFHFNHGFGRRIDCNVTLSDVWAEVAFREYKSAPKMGWLPSETKPPYWTTGRQVRIDVSQCDSASHKFPRNLHFTVTQIDGISDLRLERLWEQHTRNSILFHDSCASHNDLLRYQPEHKRLILIYNNSRLFAYSLIRTWPVFVSLQLILDQRHPELDIGVHSQFYEINIVKQSGYRYLYLGCGYDTSSLWMAEFDGFQFWTGENWSTDRKKYMQLCNYEAKLNHITELS